MEKVFAVYINPELPKITGTMIEGEDITHELFLAYSPLASDLHITEDDLQYHITLEDGNQIANQLTTIITQFAKKHHADIILYGTGDPNEPEILEEFMIPAGWFEQKPFYFTIERVTVGSEADIVTYFENRNGGTVVKKWYKFFGNRCHLTINRNDQIKHIRLHGTIEDIVKNEVNRDARYLHVHKDVYLDKLNNFFANNQIIAKERLKETDYDE